MKQLLFVLRRNHFSLLVIIVFSVLVSSCSMLSAHEIKLFSHDYESIDHVWNLPKPVRMKFGRQYHGIANPGESYNSGCLVGGGQPRAQLCMAGLSKNKFGFVLYQVGGFVVRGKMLLYQLESGRIIGQSECDVPCNFKDIDALKEYVQSGRADCRGSD